MAAALEWNLNHGQRNVRLFEIGRSYHVNGFESVETPVLTIGATGEAREKGIYENAREYEFADLKGDLDAIGALAGGFDWISDWPQPASAWLHAARRGTIHLLSADLQSERTHNPSFRAKREISLRLALQGNLRGA